MCRSTVSVIPRAFRRFVSNTLSIADHATLGACGESGQGTVLVVIVGARLANGNVGMLANTIIEDSVGRTLW